jgi:hypothetical protein
VNDTTALDALHFTYEAWSSSAAKPQSTTFLAWMKTELEHRVPVVYAVYLSDGGGDPDYDHIVPAVGIHATHVDDVALTDEIVMNDNFDDRIVVPVADAVATRASCTRPTTAGGCIPRDIDYGVAITGLTGAGVTVRLEVDGDSEPNVSVGQSPGMLTGTITAQGLVAGHSYVLQRSDDGVSYHDVVELTATADEWSYVDGVKIPTDGKTFYRCVEH